MSTVIRVCLVLGVLLPVNGCSSRTDQLANNPQSEMKRYKYQCWEGGPHIVIPNAVAQSWAGHRMGADPLDPNTDYGRAGKVERWFGFIDVADKQALVLPDPPLAAWDPQSTNSQHYFFVVWAWETEDIDGLIDRAKAQVVVKSTDRVWDVPDGARMIFAGDDPNGTIVGRIDIPQLAGTYRLSTGEYDSEGDGHVFVIRLDLLDNQNADRGK